MTRPFFDSNDPQEGLPVDDDVSPIGGTYSQHEAAEERFREPTDDEVRRELQRRLEQENEPN